MAKMAEFGIFGKIFDVKLAFLTNIFEPDYTI